MTSYSFRSTIVAALLTLLMLGFLGARGTFGAAPGPAVLTGLGFAGLIGPALLIAHLVCGIAIGGRIPDDRRIGLGAILLMATAYAAFALLSLGIAGRFGLGRDLPDFAGVGASATMVAWLAWLMVWRFELRAREAEDRR